MTRSELRKLVRSHLNEQGIDWIAETDDALFSIDDYLNLAYTEYARLTCCFVAEYTATVAAGSTFRFADLATPSPTIFLAQYVAWNGTGLPLLTRPRLSQWNRNWRTLTAGTPIYAVQQGTGAIRVVPAASASGSLYVEGYETRPGYAWASDTDVPPIDEIDHALLAAYAVCLIAVRGVTDENAVRQTALYPLWQDGTTRAKGRYLGTGPADIEVARYAGARSLNRRVSESITRAT